MPHGRSQIEAPATGTVNEYEIQREARIAKNREVLMAMGIAAAALELQKASVNARNDQGGQRKACGNKQTKQPRLPCRRSSRIKGQGPDGSIGSEVELVDDGQALVDVLGRGLGSIPDRLDPEKEMMIKSLQEQRCNNRGRGSLYDSAVGITCHFCRQKKLCAEPDCQRCARRDPSLACLGKTECSRCGLATGRFCRACLLIRYGLVLEEVRKEMRQGSWLCPHCHEDQHPGDGWICNASICMKRRGMQPTGIAIFDANLLGFESVAHWLQKQLQNRPYKHMVTYPDLPFITSHFGSSGQSFPQPYTSGQTSAEEAPPTPQIAQIDPGMAPTAPEPYDPGSSVAAQGDGATRELPMAADKEQGPETMEIIGLSTVLSVDNTELREGGGLQVGPPLRRSRRRVGRVPPSRGDNREVPVGPALIGHRVQVYWPLDQAFYPGVVQSFNDRRGEHKVLYDDGTVEDLVMTQEKWELIKDDQEAAQ